MSVVNADDLITDPRFLAWSHQEISFNHENRWAVIPKPGRFPCINSVQFERVIIDGGSSIDIMFCNSLPALKLSQVNLKPYEAQFWGVLLGQSSIPLGQITLPVQFETTEHFRTDYINFVVADFDNTYHAILGRPALTKFMAMPHYSYLVLKMPTEHDVLTLRGNVYTAYICEEEGFKVAEATDLSIRMEQTLVTATKTPTRPLGDPRATSPTQEHQV
jgi:hypothetical protein